MDKIFYTDQSRFPSSLDSVQYVLSEYYGIEHPEILRNEHGKPYLKAETGLSTYFSISHTDGKLFIAVSSKPVGIDAEATDRKTDYAPVVKKFTERERAEIVDIPSFLKHWTVKESAIKFLGGSLATDLKKLEYADGTLTYEHSPICANVTTLRFGKYVVSVCGGTEFLMDSFTAF
ncbi:MAG: 4'-phosphopantetheinyl transferase superfamily protein [Clostridia bacterium]|nr:4'-phosphopantetheinyl transferase superfamily protein [Clostridia bacterium]